MCMCDESRGLPRSPVILCYSSRSERFVLVSFVCPLLWATRHYASGLVRREINSGSPSVPRWRVRDPCGSFHGDLSGVDHIRALIRILAARFVLVTLREDGIALYRTSI